MRPILTGLLLFTLLYIISDFFVKYSSFGLLPHAIELTLFGSEEEFLDPITKASFLEFWHIEIFFLMMILLTLSAVFARLSSKSRILITNIVMISAFVSLVSLALAFFASKIFIWLYVISFFLWHIFASYMALFSLWKLYDSSI